MHNKKQKLLKNTKKIKIQQAEKAHLLLLRLTTLSFCMSPISSGKDSSLLECRNSTVALFQLPICEASTPMTLTADSEHTD